jgi:hypothetical protein
VRRGYHKPIMIAGGLGASRRRRRTSCPSRRHAAGAAGRAGHAHRHGRRRRQLDGRRQQHRGAGLRLGAARQPRDPAPRAGGHQPLLGAGRATTRCWPSTTSAPAASATPSRSWWTAPARAPLRPAQGAAGRIRPGAQGDLVQREPGALRAGHQPRPAAAVRADVRARALPVRGGRRGHRRAAAGAGGRPRRRACDRHADGRAAGQAAQDARATCSAWRANAARPDRRRSWSRWPSTCCATPRWPASASW